MARFNFCSAPCNWLYGHGTLPPLSSSPPSAFRAASTAFKTSFRSFTISLFSLGQIFDLPRSCSMRWLCVRAPYRVGAGEDRCAGQRGSGHRRVVALDRTHQVNQFAQIGLQLVQYARLPRISVPTSTLIHRQWECVERFRAVAPNHVRSRIRLRVRDYLCPCTFYLEANSTQVGFLSVLTILTIPIFGSGFSFRSLLWEVRH